MAVADADWESPGAPEAAATGRGEALPGVLDFGRVLAFLRAEALTIAVVTAVVTGLAVAAWVVWPARYTASALVMVDPRNAKVTTLDEVLPGIGGDTAAISSIAEVATADGALMPLVRAEKLGEDPEFAGSAIGTPVAEEVALGSLRKAVRVNRRGLTYVIEVSATAKSADKAARIANAVADDIVDRQSATRINASANASGALEARLADLRAAALASEKAVSEYRMTHGLLDVTPDSTVGQRRLASLAQQAAAVRGRLEEAKARWDELRRTKPEDIGTGAAPRSDLLVTLRGQLAEERRQAAELTRTYGERHPRVEASRERLASLQDQIRAEAARLVDQAKSEVDTLAKQNAALESDISKRTNAELAMNQDEVVLRDLIRQAEADRQIYEQFLTRQKSTHEQSSLTRPETEVASRALPPLRSNRPSLALVGPVGLILGLFAGIGVAVLRHAGRARPVAAAAAAAPAPAAAVDLVPPPAPADDPASDPLVVADRRPDAPDAAAPRADAPVAPAFEDEFEDRPRLGVRLRRRGTRPEPERIFAELGTPVVADLPPLAPPPARLGRRGDTTVVGDVDLDVVDARPAMLPFAETFFPHLKANPGQTLMVTNVPGAVGRTTMALAIGRMAEAVGLSALVVTDHGEARDLHPSFADVLSGRHDLAGLPPAETVDHVSVMGFGGAGDDGFWDFAEDRRLPALMARLTRHWDLVVVESTAPEGADRDVLPPTEAFGAVLLVADRDRNTMADVSANARLWADHGGRLVMVGLNAA